jgi:hypothetical protein
MLASGDRHFSTVSVIASASPRLLYLIFAPTPIPTSTRPKLARPTGTSRTSRYCATAPTEQPEILDVCRHREMTQGIVTLAG